MISNQCSYVCTVREDIIAVTLPSGDNVDVPRDLIKRSGTLSNTVPTTDPESEFTLVFPTGYLEASLQHADELSHYKSPLACSSGSQTSMRDLVLGLKVRIFSHTTSWRCHSPVLCCIERVLAPVAIIKREVVLPAPIQPQIALGYYIYMCICVCCSCCLLLLHFFTASKPNIAQSDSYKVLIVSFHHTGS